jgi:predicted nucleic acid-binding protein
MINIFLDTNIWITFVAKDNPTGLLEDLTKRRVNNEIILLTNEIIIAEWYRNKQQTVNDITSNVKSNLKQKYIAADSLANFLSPAEKKLFHEIITTILKQEKSIITMAVARVEETERLLLSCKMTPVTNEMKLKITDWALNKRAPFKKKSNSVGDALILLSAVEYCKANTIGITDSIFVSFNHEEYSSPGDKDAVHEDLVDLINEANMTYTRNIGEALHLAPQLISQISDYIDYQVNQWIEMENEIARGK